MYSILHTQEGNMPSHPHQLDAVMKGLKKTTLFSGDASADTSISPGPIAPEQPHSEVIRYVCMHAHCGFCGWRLEREHEREREREHVRMSQSVYVV
jgi:hypothetical protein